MAKAPKNSNNPYESFLVSRTNRLLDWDANFEDADYEQVKNSYGGNIYKWHEYNPWVDISFESKPIIPPGTDLDVVAKQVLEKYDLEYDDATLGECLPYPVGVLPGCDIRNQSASQTLMLSCGEALKNEFFVEVYMDGDGIARFRKIGQTDPGLIDVRYSVPTGTFKFPIDAIIITGWKPPPYRWVGDNWKNYLLNSELIELPQFKTDDCLELELKKTAFISYDRPLIVSQFNDIIKSEYELTTYDNYLGNIYMINWDGGAPLSTLTFSDSTRYWERLYSGPGNFGFRVYRYYPDPDEITWVSEVSGCWLDFSEAVFDIGGSYIQIGPYSHYEAQWDEDITDLQEVSRILFEGNRVWTYTYSTWLQQETLLLMAYIEKETHTIDNGSYVLQEQTDGNGFRYYNLAFRQYYNNEYAANYQDHLQEIPNKNWRWYDKNRRFHGTFPPGGDWIADFAGSKAGWVVSGMWAEVVRSKPSVMINSNQAVPNDAVSLADSLVVKYLPVVVTSPPAPRAVVTNTVSPYPMNQIINELECTPDLDPRTIQEYTDTDCFKMEENMMGNVQEFTFPFLDAEETLNVANTLFDILEEEEDLNTMSYVLGPDSEPVLGGSYPAGTRNIINSIEFSYQDSSSYYITINTGPMNYRGGFGGNLYQLENEEYSAPGFVQKSAGNGWLFLVDVRGFGLIPAVNTTMSDLEIGNEVQVTIHNNPVFSYRGAY